MSTSMDRLIQSRQHSSRIQQLVTVWLATAQSSTELKPLLANWSPTIRSIAAEATFLGFPKTIRLCRVLLATLECALASDGPLSTKQQQAITIALNGLGILVATPSADSVDVSAIVRRLSSDFQLTDTTVNTPLKGLVHDHIMSPSDVSSASTTSEHRDMDVYLNSRLDSLDRCYEEETWIVTQLAGLAEDLASGTHSQRPASRLMAVLKSHKIFHQVDRVCLAGRVAEANQLVVVDSAASERCQTNSLKTGYSCFVNPEGSLFKMRPGTMRIFDDSERVLAAFSHQNKPAQRSIALIADMGLRSGLCLAIGRGADIQGFLFLNSCQQDLFGDITVNFAPLLSLLGLVATIALDANGFHRTVGKGSSIDRDVPHCSTLFVASEFKQHVSQAIQRRIGPDFKANVTVSVNAQDASFLYLPARVAGTLAEIVLRLNLLHVSQSADLHFEVECHDEQVQVRVLHRRNLPNLPVQEWLNANIQLLNANLINTPLKIQADETYAMLVFPIEPVLTSHQDLHYSIVY
ncbi:MAG: hypothetical protein IT423_05815 [Pirellulaceae bacterium]|nr:hypothetical protein [Pirellulaceae bacterium]